MTHIYEKIIDFTIQVPEEKSFVTMCAGMVHHGMEYTADMTIQVENGQTVDLKSILGIMTLCYANGRKAQITIKGDDRLDVEKAYTTLLQYVKDYSQE